MCTVSEKIDITSSLAIRNAHAVAEKELFRYIYRGGKGRDDPSKSISPKSCGRPECLLLALHCALTLSLKVSIGLRKHLPSRPETTETEGDRDALCRRDHGRPECVYRVSQK